MERGGSQLDRTVPVHSITGSYQIGPALVTEATTTSLCISRHPFLRHYPHHKVWPMCVRSSISHTHTHSHTHTILTIKFGQCVYVRNISHTHTHTHTPLANVCMLSYTTHTHTHLPASRDRLTYFNHHSAPRPLLTLME